MLPLPCTQQLGRHACKRELCGVLRMPQTAPLGHGLNGQISLEPLYIALLFFEKLRQESRMSCPRFL